MAQVIRTPDQRLRVFVSSTLGELADERRAVRAALERLRLVPVMFELGARPHPPRELYRAYLAQSHVFLGIYWQRYGWVAPGEGVSGLEDEYRLAGDRPRLIYLKQPAPDREPRLTALLDDVRDDDRTSDKHFTTTEELAALVETDLAVLLTERFEAADRFRDDDTDDEITPPAPPLPLTPTIGRELDLDRIAGQFDGGARLVTLTGVGGIGKSRLAIEVGHRLQDRFPGRVWFVPLATITDPDAVIPAVSDRLGARTIGALTHLDALVQRLGTHPTLVILDNFEQVVGAAPELTTLLERCPQLHLLVTSRQALRVAGEHEYPVAPLAQSSPSAAVAEAAAAPAVALFVDRARAVRPDFGLTAANLDDVAAVCRVLDGLPLAIELAAACLRLLSPAQLHARLRDSFDVLVGAGDRPERQRTLRATIDWSHDLLAPDEQALFARLSVFHGGCTLEQAERVCGLPGSVEVLDTLAALLDKSLVVMTDEDSDAPRFRMLETVRTYAAERLAERGETGLMRDRHLDWFRRFTDEAQPYLCGPQQLLWAARVDPERATLRAAISHAFERGDVAAVVEMGWDVYVYYALRGVPDEVAAWMAAASERRDGLDERLTAILETGLAIAEVTRGDFTCARERLTAVLPVFDHPGLELELAVRHMYLGLVDMRDADYAAAVAAEETASQVFASIDHDWGVASSEAFLGLLHWIQDDFDRAATHYLRSLARAEGISNEQLSGQALVGLAAIALSRADLADAERHLARAVPLLQRSRDLLGTSSCLEVIAAAALAHDRPETADAALAVATASREKIGMPLHPRLQERVDGLVAAVAARRTGDGRPTIDVDGDPVAALPTLLGAIG